MKQNFSKFYSSSDSHEDKNREDNDHSSDWDPTPTRNAGNSNISQHTSAGTEADRNTHAGSKYPSHTSSSTFNTIPKVPLDPRLIVALNKHRFYNMGEESDSTSDTETDVSQSRSFPLVGAKSDEGAQLAAHTTSALGIPKPVASKPSVAPKPVRLRTAMQPPNKPPKPHNLRGLTPVTNHRGDPGHDRPTSGLTPATSNVQTQFLSATKPSESLDQAHTALQSPHNTVHGNAEQEDLPGHSQDMLTLQDDQHSNALFRNDLVDTPWGDITENLH